MIRKLNSSKDSTSRTIAVSTATASAVGSVVPGIGTVIGAIVGLLSSIVSIGFLQDCSASQEAEDKLGQLLDRLRGGKNRFNNWVDKNLQQALDTLINQDLTQHPEHWPVFIQQNGNPPYLAYTNDTERNTVCQSNDVKFECVATIILHSRPQCSLSGSAHETYVNMVTEFMTNVTKYLTGLGKIAIINNQNESSLYSNILNGTYNINDIYKGYDTAEQDYNSQGGGGSNIKKSDLLSNPIALVMLLGAVVGGVLFYKNTMTRK